MSNRAAMASGESAGLIAGASVGNQYTISGWATTARTSPTATSVPVRQRQVCSCFDVSESRITEALASCDGSSQDRLAALQSTLRCGTQCGSCLPELKKLVAAAPQTV